MKIDSHVLLLTRLVGLLICLLGMQQGELTAETAKPLNICYGYRGNGSSVFATVGGIARLFDQYGSPDAIVGTSSGALAGFLTESVMTPNPVYLYNQQGEQLSKKIGDHRRSFMLKSFPLLVSGILSAETVLGREFQIFSEFYLLIKRWQDGFSRRQSHGLSWNQEREEERIRSVITKAALLTLRLRTKELHHLISPAFYQVSGLDGGTANPELIDGILANLLSFQGVHHGSGFQRKHLFYPGIINFDYLFQLAGLVGDWFSGYGSGYPHEKLTALLDKCAEDSQGRWWNRLAQRSFGETSTCGEQLHRLFIDYFNLRIRSPRQRNRIDEPIGRYVPSFVSTSAIAGNDMVDLFTMAADRQHFHLIDEPTLSRNHFKVLYFGPERFVELVAQNRRRFDDVISLNSVSMGSVSWLSAMKASGQEPGTARAGFFEKNGNKYLATGGFVDQLPSKFMRNINCQKIIAINTNRPILHFASRYTEAIWDDPLLVDDLLGSHPRSSESLAFEETDALLCARWDPYELTEIWEMADNAFHNMIFSRFYAEALGDHLPIQVATPRQCYLEPDQRGHRFPPYQLPIGAGN